MGKTEACPRGRKYAFPSMGLDVKLSMHVPVMNDGTYTSADRSQFSLGMAQRDVSWQRDPGSRSPRADG